MAITKEARLAEVRAWGASVEGRQIDTDGFPARQPYQCVDVSKHYGYWLHDVPRGAYGNGKDVAWNLSRLPGWKWVPATERGQAGDVVSWGAPFGVSKETGIEYGHTGVLADDDDGGELDVYQADGFTSGARVYRAKNSRRGLRGFARPPRYVAEEVAAASPSTVGVGADSYKVREGDTLWQIASRLGTTVDRIVDLNPGLDRDRIVAGETIRVSGPKASTTTVKAGEGPWQVSQRAGITLAEFYRLNGREELHPGDVVKVSA